MKELERHAGLFNLIAPIYNRFFNAQVKNYRNILAQFNKRLGMSKEAKILDIGCGTGAFLFCLAELGYQCSGIDFAPSMLKAAKKSTAPFVIDFQLGDATKQLPFSDKSFDLVISSYVLHGVTSNLRHNIFVEANRLSRGKILIYDYNQTRRFLTDFIEWAEGGDYFNFIRNGEQEMRDFFKEVEKYDMGTQTSIYYCSTH